MNSTSLSRFLSLLPDSFYRTRKLSAGEFLFRQQQEVSHIYGIQSGRVHLFRDLPDGSSIILHVAQSGQTFAEAALFTSHYHCHAKADIDSEILCINAHDLKQLLHNNSLLGMDVLQLLAGQIRDLRAHLMLRDIRSADDRLLTWLRHQARESFTPASERSSPSTDQATEATRGLLKVAIGRTWSAIAEELGLTREATYRSLASLERNGKITREKGIVWLSDGNP